MYLRVPKTRFLAWWEGGGHAFDQRNILKQRHTSYIYQHATFCYFRSVWRPQKGRSLICLRATTLTLILHDRGRRMSHSQRCEAASTSGESSVAGLLQGSYKGTPREARCQEHNVGRRGERHSNGFDINERVRLVFCVRNGELLHFTYAQEGRLLTPGHRLTRRSS